MLKGFGILSSKYDIPIYANSNTWDYIQDSIKHKVSDSNKKIFNTLESFEIGNLEILPFNIPHDAADPCGFNIYGDSQKISIATDLGHVDSTIIKHFENSSSILLEANYSSEILQVSSYPYILKKRISGPKGHLENTVTADTICKLINSGLKNALLVHLSNENNFPELVSKTMEEILIKNNYSSSDVNISIAPRSSPSQMFKAV